MMRWPWVRRSLLDAELEHSRDLAGLLDRAAEQVAQAHAERDELERARVDLFAQLHGADAELEAAQRERDDLAARLKASETARDNALRRAASAEVRMGLLLDRMNRVDEKRTAEVQAGAERVLAAIDQAVA